MLNFLADVCAVVVGIYCYKRLEDLYDEVRWKFKQRHASRSDPWDRW